MMRCSDRSRFQSNNQDSRGSRNTMTKRKTNKPDEECLALMSVLEVAVTLLLLTSRAIVHPQTSSRSPI